jgi:type I restriction enzyme, S subunit
MTSTGIRRWGDVAFEKLIAGSAFGPRFSGSAYADDGNIATLRTTDLDDDGRISYETMPLARLNEDRFDNHLLVAGDLVITRSGTCGIAAVFEGFSIPVLPGAFLIRFRMNERAEPRFYRYYFNSLPGRSNILSVARGAVQQNINITNVKTLRVPLPPISEQRRIVSILSAYDSLIENNRRRMKLLEETARLLYQEWFARLRFPGHKHVKITKGVPEGWERGTFQTALLLQRGFDLPIQSREDGDVPIYGSTGINGVHNKAKVIGPGVVTGRSGTLGEVHYISRDFWPLNTALWVKEFRRVTPLFALFLMREMDLKQYNGGVSVPTLDRKTVHRAEVLIPPPLLIRSFDEFAAPLFQQINILTAQVGKLRAARDLLLPRLMSGEISV